MLIPVFALGKTQEVLAMFYKFKRGKLLEDVPIYIGGLSSKMTEIYDRRANNSPRVIPRLQLFPEVAPFVLNGKTIQETPARPGRIYALSSGMMTPKTLSNIFARRVIDRPEHSIFFVGYADPESPAGILRRAQPNELVSLDEDEPANRCVARSSSSSLARTLRANRSSITSRKSRRAKWCSCMATRRRSNGCGRQRRRRCRSAK